MNRFSSVTIDVDSTLCGLEGIDWLAGRRDADVSKKVSALTARAMDGSIALDAVYDERLALVAPTRDEVAALATAYKERLAPGAIDSIRTMIDSGVEVHLISGGLLAAITDIAAAIPLPKENVHAVEIRFGADGSYEGFDNRSPLARQGGKREILERLSLARPALMVGDGMTDAEARPAVDAFAAFTGFARREAVIDRSDYVVSTFQELLELVTQ